MSPEELEQRFWEWRKRGRPAQTLQQDLTFFLTAWQHEVGWQACSAVYKAAMASQQWDISQGGRVPQVPVPVVRPARKKGGLMVYG